MLIKQLIISFMNNDLGRKFSIRVDEPRDNLYDDDVKAVAEVIVAKGIFGDIVPTGAKIVQTTTETLEI